MLKLHKYPNIEHVRLSDPKYDQIVEMISKSYPNSCVIEILKVYPSISLEEDFLNHFKKFEHTNPKIVELFHGTSENSIESITQEGFMVSKNKISAFGKGTYFSNSAAVSLSYGSAKSKKEELVHVIIADVVIGNDPITGYAGTEDKTHTHYVNSMRSPNYFCVPHDNGAIPRYVVSFHTNVS